MRHPIHPKRPCRVCRCWFRPDPRVGDRQKTCGGAGCQREWNRRLSRARRRREPHREREGRLRDRLQRVEGEAVGGLPEQALDQKVARQAIGSEAFVVIGEYSRVVLERVRHEFPLQLGVSQRKSSRLLPVGVRHEIGTGRAPP
jgi:hypothetical protein